MSHHRLAACIVTAALLMLIVPLHMAQSQEYYQYTIQLQSDGSAYWTITQFSSANATVESWDGLQQKIFGLIDDASVQTHRIMDVDENSVQINTTLSFDSKTTEYSFLWQNFSINQDDTFTFGDVFVLPNFFSRLFGDASLQVTYPASYTVQSVYPPPREETDHALKWARTQDLVGGDTRVVLTQNGTDGTDSSRRQIWLVAVVALAIGIAASILGIYWYRKRRNNSTSIVIPTEEPSPIESEEDKILRLLRAQGGVMRQSDITEQSRFSKAKTSQLLSELESRGALTRYKKGRDKIVTLKEGRVGDKK